MQLLLFLKTKKEGRRGLPLDDSEAIISREARPSSGWTALPLWNEIPEDFQLPAAQRSLGRIGGSSDLGCLHS